MTDKVEGSPKTSHEQEEEPENADKTEIHQKLSDYAARNKRMTGTCKWYQVTKGYGFIVDDETKEDLFVHQTHLMMEGFRSLDAGERVGYYVRRRENNKGFEAYHVTAEKPGERLRGSSVHPIGKKRMDSMRCYKCGQYANHVAKNCDKPIQGKTCYNCNSTEHLSTTCPFKEARPRFSKDIAKHENVSALKKQMQKSKETEGKPPTTEPEKSSQGF